MSVRPSVTPFLALLRCNAVAVMFWGTSSFCHPYGWMYVWMSGCETGTPPTVFELDRNFDLWPRLGSMGPPNGQKQSFLFRAVEALNFQDLPLFALENYQ